MSLDDAIARAMSKQPGDRYPSAGDLGRAAQAALTGAPVAVPERTVATGAAAAGEADSELAPKPPAPAEDDEPPTPPTAAVPPTEPAGQEPSTSMRLPRPAAIVGIVLAALVAVGVAVALISSGGGDGSSAGSGTPDTTAAKDVTSGEGEQPKAKPKPKPLTRAELIAKGDAICADSQVAFKEAHEAFPNGEEEANVAYSKQLTEISGTANPRFRALDAPASIRATYREYVEAQERVGAYDQEALAAARQGDLSAYLAAREKRDNEAGQRYNLARAIGFEACSASPS
jgi:hypothetical protein